MLLLGGVEGCMSCTDGLLGYFGGLFKVCGGISVVSGAVWCSPGGGFFR